MKKWWAVVGAAADELRCRMCDRQGGKVLVVFNCPPEVGSGGVSQWVEVVKANSPGVEVFVRRDRAAAAGCAVTAGGDGPAVARLWATEEWWREWWSGAMKAAVVVIRSRRCFGGRVYSLGAAACC